MDYENISLIGFMGSGKSTVGKVLAGRIGFIFIDLDRIIELEMGIEIKDIFKNYGEKYFRNLESKVIEKVYKNKNCVFACGGGAVQRKKNVDILRKNSRVVYLNVSPEISLSRLKDVKDRPLINVDNREDIIRKMIKRRDMLYRESADIVVDNNGEDTRKTSKEILTRLDYLF
ncbi:MAG: shikimate kinase [Actinomycetota bacterium]|nr:shikimate kinase [Actinomycetota bacterium]